MFARFPLLSNQHVHSKEHSSFHSTKDIHFRSRFGDIDVYSISQEDHMSDADDATFKISALSNKNITFNSGSSTFHTLDVASSGGIYLPYNLSTTVGDLDLTFLNDELFIGDEVDVTSASKLTFTGHKIDIMGPSIFTSTQNLTIYPPVNVLTSHDLIMNSHENVFIYKKTMFHLDFEPTFNI